MDIHRVVDTIIVPFRKRRMRRFLEVIRPSPENPVLDVGGTDFNWRLIGWSGRVFLINLSHSGQAPAKNFFAVRGDACQLPYADGSFEVVYSNSVVEHVGSFEEQQRFAREARRVGRSLWIQTPARSFFIEPHYITPFIHWLPSRWQKRLLRNFSVWGLITRPDQEYIDRFVDQTRLLTLAEMTELFPDCTILRERFLFMTKAYIAVRTTS